MSSGLLWKSRKLKSSHRAPTSLASRVGEHQWIVDRHFLILKETTVNTEVILFNLVVPWRVCHCRPPPLECPNSTTLLRRRRKGDEQAQTPRTLTCLSWVLYGLTGLAHL